MGNELRANLNRLAHAFAGSRALSRALMLALIPAVTVELIALLSYVHAQPPAASPTPAPTNANWCPGVPESPPPPGWSTGEWAAISRQCSAPGHDRILCGRECAAARERWAEYRNPPSPPQTRYPLSTSVPQGPFPLPGGGEGYILPLSSPPATPEANAPQGSADPPGPIPGGSYAGADWNAYIRAPESSKAEARGAFEIGRTLDPSPAEA